MKNLLILFLIVTSSLFSQSNWNNVVQTTIPFIWGSQQQGKIDQYANKDGIHILLISSPTFYPLYYLINSSGSVIRSHSFENNTVEFPSIDGDNDKVYIVYKLGNQIKTKKSTNTGQSWTNLGDINIENNLCNNIDITFSNYDNALQEFMGKILLVYVIVYLFMQFGHHMQVEKIHLH